MKYNFKEIEKKWQQSWEAEKVFQSLEDDRKPKFYCLEMFPYPSGRIHMGHVRNYSIGDVVARQKRMRGFNVLHPMGWDALGMPAENAAIKHGLHPKDWTLKNIEFMKAQLKKLGFSYDWTRELATCMPEYYKWNQYIFIKMFEKDLAYKKKAEVNWCPSCKTVLANEQVIVSKCWRCDSLVESKELDQWFLKIVDYADELLQSHDQLQNWPTKVLLMQKNWIGKSEGAGFSFEVEGTGLRIEIFTTRLDTIFGSTFVALSVQHPLVKELIQDHPDSDGVEAFIREIERERKVGRELTEKKGFFTGKYAINPFNGERIPIWLANFVLIEYGTGAIMSVPAHDERDFEFARKYNIPVRRVIVEEKNKSYPNEVDEVFVAKGYLINSGPYDGLSSDESIEKMGKFLTDNRLGELKTMFRIRDWGISRQRFWGTPIPILYCEKCGVVPESIENLPVKLPEDVEFTVEGGLLLKHSKSFLNGSCPTCGGPAQRETDTMDTFFDSSWYYFRYAGASDQEPFKPESIRYWLPVDFYVGGETHAILHLIYSRFFTYVFRDMGWTNIAEPFPHLLTQGMVTLGGSAMSKSRGNVVDPDHLVEKYGADTVRLFILFAAPPEKNLEWNEQGVEGVDRFLHRIWNLFHRNQELFSREREFGIADPASQELYTRLQQTIKKVTEDIEVRFHLNTAIAAMMEFFNELSSAHEILKSKNPGLLKHCFEELLKLLSPFTPHFCDELWEKTGHQSFLANQSWPEVNLKFVSEEWVNIMIQINGKIREKIKANLDEDEARIKEMALNSEKVMQYTQGKEMVKIIYVKNKMLSIVVK
ncbi:MAG: leucine--tRNA ligase [Candidatus Aminicenantes bacterium]|nr:leucine--tRNA ligase [Candidatus Aminicenantes bacterium]